MRYESKEAVEAKLAERYDGPILERAGANGMTFSYIPWTETVRRLNAVFGAGGWDIANVRVMYAEGVYTVSVELSVTATIVRRVTDKETGEIEEREDTYGWSKTVPGVGSAVARGASDDNASKAALSDAISRAAKLLGDQFGFFLYEKGGSSSSAPAAPRAANHSAPVAKVVKSENTGKPASDAQKGLLKRLGYEGPVDGLTMGEASALINELKQAEASVW